MLTGDGHKVDVASCEDAFLVRKRLLLGSGLRECEKSPFATDGVEQCVKPLKVAFVKRFEER